MARLYTRDNLLDASQFSAAFQNMDRRVDAAIESRRKMADAATNAFNALGEVGKAAYQKKLQDDRYKSIDDKDLKYREDPTWIAAKEEYARTGNSSALNSVQNAFDARERAIIEKQRQELEKQKMAENERKINQEMYDQELVDWEYNNKQLMSLNPSSADYQSEVDKYTRAIKKNEIAMTKYGKALDENWTMPEYVTAATTPAKNDNYINKMILGMNWNESIGDVGNRLGQVDVTESTSETTPATTEVGETPAEAKQNATYNEVETLISTFNADHPKKYSYKLEDLKTIKTKLDQLQKNTKEYNDLYKSYKELEKYTAEKKKNKKSVLHKTGEHAGEYEYFVNGKSVGFGKKKDF